MRENTMSFFELQSMLLVEENYMGAPTSTHIDSKMLYKEADRPHGRPQKKRTTLSPHATKCIFLGYGTDGEFRYELWDPENQRLICSSDVVFNEACISSRNQQKIVGKRVSFEIAKDNVEGSAHRTECTKEDEVHTYPDTEDGPLARIKDKVIKEKAESTHVEKGNNAIKRVGTDRVDPTNTSKAKGRSQNELIMTTDLQHEGDDHALPKSYTWGEASHKTPDDGSQYTDQPTELIDEHEPHTAVLRRSGRARRPTEFYQPGLNYVNYTDVSKPYSYKEVIAASDVEP